MSRETQARFLKRQADERAKKRDTVIGTCCGCGIGILPKAFVLGGAIRLGNGKFLCNQCEGG